MKKGLARLPFKIRLFLVALELALPIGIYFALKAGQEGIALIFFVIMVIGLFLVAVCK